MTHTEGQDPSFLPADASRLIATHSHERVRITISSQNLSTTFSMVSYEITANVNTDKKFFAYEDRSDHWQREFYTNEDIVTLILANQILKTLHSVAGLAQLVEWAHICRGVCLDKEGPGFEFDL